MNRALRLSLVMAILGFILGLGFLVRLPSPEARSPASSTGSAENETAFLEPKWGRDFPALEDEVEASDASLADETSVDKRADLLFDVHTVARSRFAKDTDAYVLTRFTSSARTEITRFTYCHNYDYSKQRARPTLNRFSSGSDGFECYGISIALLAEGASLIDTPFGEMLTLKSKPGFDPKKGGTISVQFAYRVAKLIGRNDYRTLDLHVTLSKGVVNITGPRGEDFDWFNLKMSEDIVGFPSGVTGFVLYEKGSKVSTYTDADFAKLPASNR